MTSEIKSCPEGQLSGTRHLVIQILCDTLKALPTNGFSGFVAVEPFEYVPGGPETNRMFTQQTNPNP